MADLDDDHAKIIEALAADEADEATYKLLAATHEDGSSIQSESSASSVMRTCSSHYI